MKKILTLLAIAISTSSFAQTAKSVLDKTASVLRSYPSCSAYFAAAMGSQGGMNGTITIQGNKFYISGKEASVWFDGTTQWMLVNGTNEVNITNPTPQELQRMNPYFFLNLYKSGYDLHLDTNTKLHVVTLTAQKGQSLKTMEITIDKATSLPTRVQMVSKRGTTNTISISSIKKGGKLPESRFRFNAKDNPKVTVVDLR